MTWANVVTAGLVVVVLGLIGAVIPNGRVQSVWFTLLAIGLIVWVVVHFAALRALIGA